MKHAAVIYLYAASTVERKSAPFFDEIRKGGASRR